MLLEKKGNYILILKLDKNSEVNVGKLGKIKFKKGYYAYVGSAMKGFKARIPRYFRKERRKHWHIDYLLDFAKIVEIILIVSKENLEEEIARKLSERFEYIPRFGCSDKKSVSHLFYLGESLKDILTVLCSL